MISSTLDENFNEIFMILLPHSELSAGMLPSIKRRFSSNVIPRLRNLMQSKDVRMQEVAACLVFNAMNG